MKLSRSNRAGMTLVEIVLALGLFTALLVGVGETFGLLISERDMTSAETRMTSKAFDAINEIARDVRQCGWTEDGVYPYLFTDAQDPGEGFEMHVHATAHEDGIGSINREIVFVNVADDNTDGIPDVELDGSINWDTEEISYVLIPGLRGRNQIERRIDGVFDRVIARDVESLVFDDWWTSGSEVPLGCLRVRAVFGVEVDGATVRRQVERTVRLIQEVD